MYLILAARTFFKILALHSVVVPRLELGVRRSAKECRRALRYARTRMLSPGSAKGATMTQGERAPAGFSARTFPCEERRSTTTSISCRKWKVNCVVTEQRPDVMPEGHRRANTARWYSCESCVRGVSFAVVQRRRTVLPVMSWCGGRRGALA